jgi:hypothetical protein
MTNRSTGAPDGGHSTGEFDGDAVTKPEVDVKDPGDVDGDGFEILFGDELFGDESEEWTEHTSSKAFRASWFVTALSALLLMLGGIWLGAFLQRHQSSSTTSASSAFSGLIASGLRGTTGTSSNASSGASSNITSGTVTDIIGRTLYVTDSSGALISVKVSSTTTVDRNAGSSLSALKPGDTVTVQGATEKNGSVDAATISATAKGVSSPGFGGVGSFPSGVSGGSSASSGG